MAKFMFFNFPTYGQVNPTLAVIQELVDRGHEVVYVLTEPFRALIEATGAKFHAYDAKVLAPSSTRGTSTVEDNRRLAMLPIHMILTSRQMVPPLLAQAQDESPDCLVYSGLFLWARVIAHALAIPGVALWPTYAPHPQHSVSRHDRASVALTPAIRARLQAEMTHLRDSYHLPFSNGASLIRGQEGLTLVFLPRDFQPNGDAFDARYHFVGPSFRPTRDGDQAFPYERIGAPPRLYIALGTLFNNRVEFYNVCFHAFGDTEWHIILAFGDQLDTTRLATIPANFMTAAHVPQLAVLPHMDIFLSHGGMNSTMESLFYGVPLIVVPHTREQQMTAQRIAELGLGVALDEATVTAAILREAVAQIILDPGFKHRVAAMQRHIRAAGGYQRAADALQDYTQADMPRSN